MKQVDHNKLVGAHVCGHVRCVCAVFVGYLSVLFSVILYFVLVRVQACSFGVVPLALCGVCLVCCA